MGRKADRLIYPAQPCLWPILPPEALMPTVPKIPALNSWGALLNTSALTMISK